MEGINVDQVTAWFTANVTGVRPPLSFDLIAGGRSNLTFKVTDQAGHAWVLRRPPLGHVLPTAHDMRREHAIISALAATPVPVPPAVGLCEDEAVNERPFYVMGFVDGTVVRDQATAGSLSEDVRRRTGESLVDVLASIHAVDPDAVGLGDLGRKEGYIARQLKRWYAQFEQSKMREVPLLDEMHDLLSNRIPPQGPATIVHGDYRLDNCMIDEGGALVAVLDWEICTLGDPLADVGLLMVYWNDPGEGDAPVAAGATALPGFPRKADLVERYAKTSGRDVSDLPFYVSFGYWKLACILDGVYTRYAKGAMGTGSTGWEAFGESVVRLAESSRDAARQLA